VIDVLANALGSQPSSNLQVAVTPTGGEKTVGAAAQTKIASPTPTAGSPAVALLEQLAGNGSLTGSGKNYSLNLATTVQNSNPLNANLGIENGVTVPADDLSGLFTINGQPEYFNSGFDPFSNTAPGAADSEPVISLNTGTIGVFTETVVRADRYEPERVFGGRKRHHTAGDGNDRGASAASADGDRLG
jgi:hypothetical protein